MGSKITTQADRQRTAAPRAAQGQRGHGSGSGGGQRVSQERGTATRNKKHPGKRPHQGG